MTSIARSFVALTFYLSTTAAVAQATLPDKSCRWLYLSIPGQTAYISVDSLTVWSGNNGDHTDVIKNCLDGLNRHDSSCSCVLRGAPLDDVSSSVQEYLKTTLSLVVKQETEDMLKQYLTAFAAADVAQQKQALNDLISQLETNPTVIDALAKAIANQKQAPPSTGTLATKGLVANKTRAANKAKQ